MSDRSDQANAKQVASLIGRNSLEQSEYCLVCGTETDIRNLNLVTGACSACSKMGIKKLRELLEKVDL